MRSCLLAISLLLAPMGLASGADAGLQRWAIIAAPPVVQSGLSDLLTVALSGDDSIKLVERERLQDVMGELELMSLFRADKVASRLQVGKTLRADGLIIL
ncbi:MAG: hypothetical protein HKN47_20110, partial [Pirellulaceae bacterium]|nr:hypothetical protein [Pirellulaceae bacterium]